MKLSDFYEYTVRFGRERDPRGSKSVKGYEDTAILYGDQNTKVRNILVGIDIDTAELLLADRLTEERKIDLVLSHHPVGAAWASFYRVIPLQSPLWRKAGIEAGTVNGFLDERMREVSRKLLAQNHMRAVDAARLLNIPLMCAHTPADNHVAVFLQEKFNKEAPATVGELLSSLSLIPEYRMASVNYCGPRAIIGGPGRSCGRVFVDMTGGTEGPKQLFERLASGGIGTVVSMHMSEDHYSRLKSENINVVVAGHISSDTLGMNLLLDRIESRSGERFNFLECSGFRRFRRI
ncbi:MAG: NGG1p interacting factor NIF3 [Candidatus Omnitrophota bacterium]|jgi:putative NIF3 family GTP cyclohydrolase 1 type 2